MSAIDNRTSVARKDKIVKLEERQRLSDIGFVMSQAAGRRVFNDLLKRCGVGRLSFAGPGQSEQTAFYEGQRNIGNYYWSVLVKNFKKEWLLMTEEADKKQEASNAGTNSNGGQGSGNDDPDETGAAQTDS
jgi:hypothetical protein